MADTRYDLTAGPQRTEWRVQEFRIAVRPEPRIVIVLVDNLGDTFRYEEIGATALSGIAALNTLPSTGKTLERHILERVVNAMAPELGAGLVAE